MRADCIDPEEGHDRPGPEHDQNPSGSEVGDRAEDEEGQTHGQRREATASIVDPFRAQVNQQGSDDGGQQQWLPVAAREAEGDDQCASGQQGDTETRVMLSVVGVEPGIVSKGRHGRHLARLQRGPHRSRHRDADTNERAEHERTDLDG